MRFLPVLLLSIATATSTVLGASQNGNLLEKRQNGNSSTGWTSISIPETAILHEDWKISGHNFPLLLSNNTVNASRIKRAVIVVPGMERNCWDYYSYMHNARVVAAQKGIISVEEVSIAGACFLAQRDKSAGAVDDSSLVWGTISWDHGLDSVGPAGASISSYEVIDELTDYYMDPSKFPHLTTVVFAGHSMGGQMTQRYAALHKDRPNDGRQRNLHIWIANPGSMVWLVADRPHPERKADCPDFDEWKYGLNGSFVPYASDASALGRSGIVDRYRSRNVHYLFGTADTNPGSVTCQALTQGSSHIEIGRNFDAMINAMPGGLPSTHTIDYVRGVGHDGLGMMSSDAGLDKLFVVGS